MNKTICPNCHKEFDKGSENNRAVCPECDRIQKSDIQTFRILKQMFFICAFLVFSLFLPLLLVRETGHGYYELPNSKGPPIYMSGAGIYKFKIVIVILTGIFSGLGVWFGAKQREKEALYQDDDLSIK